jgi:L-seryl-tRNA(Ser) seleniumtransferase
VDDPRRRTPRTDTVLADPAVADAVNQFGRSRVKAVVGQVLGRCRAGEIAPEDVLPVTRDALPTASTSLRRVVNATGVVIHTNLGRAPLSQAAVDAIEIATGTTDVELDLDTGQRGRRGSAAMAALAAALPDAGDVHVVNNGAAALALATCALAQQRTIVVSRGELVEIGDGFRIPELLESLGARLREVGTTNRVRLDDYAEAIEDDTALVLKVHPSNFRVEGFTSSVSIAELAGLSASRGVPLLVDIGSGLLAPHPRLPDEPDAATVLRAGADLVTASGDKLLGGPQCGLLLGRAELVRRLRRHPFARALRVDKLTLAALEATLVGPPSPTAQALAHRPQDLLDRARRVADAIGPELAEAVPSEGRVGGGGAPGVPLPSAAVALPDRLAALLRHGEPPVVGHVHDGRLLLDLLTVPEDLDDVLAEAVRRAAATKES